MTTLITENKKQLIWLIVLLIVALILIQINSSGPAESEKDIAVKSTVDSATFHEKVIAVMHGFGLDDSLLYANNRKLAKNQKVSALFQINLPKNLPVPFFLHDLQKAYPQVRSLTPKERTINGDVYIDVSGTNAKTIRYEIIIRKDIEHSAGRISLLISDAEEIAEDAWGDYLQYASALSFIVPATSEGKKMAERISAAGKDYVVLLSDNADEVEYKLRDDFPLNRLNITINTILHSFPSAKFFVVDPTSKVNNSALRVLFEQRLKKAGKLLRKQSTIKVLPEQGDYSQTLTYLLQKASKDDTPAIIALGSSQYTAMHQPLQQFTKRGGELLRLPAGEVK